MHLEQNTDGTFTVRKTELSDPTQFGNDNNNVISARFDICYANQAGV
jgi:hypothetical protein